MIALSPIRPTKTGQTDPDAQLMVKVGQGDTQAFETLVEAYYDRVVFVIEHLMGNRRQSEDLAQEVFLRVYRARLNYRPESKFATWLFVIVNNVVRNARRSAARRREAQIRESNDHPEFSMERTLDDFRSVGPLDHAVREEVRAEVRDAVAQLNVRQRNAIVLYHFSGLSYAEVAEELETTLCAAKALLHRARSSLKGRLRAPSSN